MLGQKQLYLPADTCTVQKQSTDRITGHSLMILGITALNMIGDAERIVLLNLVGAGRIEEVVLLKTCILD